MVDCELVGQTRMLRHLIIMVDVCFITVTLKDRIDFSITLSVIRMKLRPISFITAKGYITVLHLTLSIFFIIIKGQTGDGRTSLNEKLGY